MYDMEVPLSLVVLFVCLISFSICVLLSYKN